MNLQGNIRADYPEKEVDSEVSDLSIRERYSEAANSVPLASRAGFQLVGVYARRNHSERHRRAAQLFSVVFRSEPERETGIVNFRLTLPKVWLQSTLYAQVIQLKLNSIDMSRKIAADVLKTNPKSRDLTADT